MNQVRRYYVCRKDGFRQGDAQTLSQVQEDLGLDGLTSLKTWVRYDVQGLSAEHEDDFVNTVLSVPFQDEVILESLAEEEAGDLRFVVELLPGQYDQRADSCAQCAQLLGEKKPLVRTATVYSFEGGISAEDAKEIQRYFINPVESRLATFDKPTSLDRKELSIDSVPFVEGLLEADETDLARILDDYDLAMDTDDMKALQAYFIEEDRPPTETELRMIDTYWSDHCRHTTFQTNLINVEIEDPIVAKAYKRYQEIREDVYGDCIKTRPETLMDLGTIATKYLKKHHKVERLDESEEINACSVKVDVDVDGLYEPWLFMFKNETHNHPTEIEPFGGASTCLGGAIRDPLSGRSYIYQGMRVSGAADPRKPIEETLDGKLPQKKICRLAAEGFASYGNQIGVSTGLVDEIYHPGYEAKRMEVGAVVAAVPEANVVRLEPTEGDIVLLIGGRTGRDGIGGATGSSKIHTEESLERSGAEVQKGNPVEERKIQRLFRRPEIAKAIKRCNDFGAGGVSVAVGELADGLDIHLDRIPLKYQGLNGTEVALAESQERMAVVIDPKDWPIFEKACRDENLEVTQIADVTRTNRVKMTFKDQVIVDIDRVFLDTAGACKTAQVKVKKNPERADMTTKGFVESLKESVADLNIASKEGLIDRFDSTVGAATVLFPKGGKTLRTPVQTMAAKIPLERGETQTTSLFAYGFDPHYTEQNPYRGAYDAVVESVCKLMTTGARSKHVYLSLQEYFPSLREDPERWGMPFQAVLGALMAQVDLEIPAIGGKDSMSGSFEELDVPPTLISFATTMANAPDVISPEFKKAGHKVITVSLERDEEGAVDTKAFKVLWKKISQDISEGKIVSGWAVTRGGILEGIFKMALGNNLGFTFADDLTMDYLTEKAFGTMIFEVRGVLDYGDVLGEVQTEPNLTWREEKITIDELVNLWKAPLEDVYPTHTPAQDDLSVIELPFFDTALRKRKLGSIAKPRILIPAMPGTNSEFDMARAFRKAGGEVETLLVANKTQVLLEESIDRMVDVLGQSQILALPGGFSFGDEPDGSGKFMAAFFRHSKLQEAIHNFIEEQDGLVLGICNGFQALVKMGLLPYGQFEEASDIKASLAANMIGRHQSQYVYTKVVSNLSPWLAYSKPNQVDRLPISHGEGRFICDDGLLNQLITRGQVACQYVDKDGKASMDIGINPSGSTAGIEAITSPCGRILGKMGHNERYGRDICKNVPGLSDQGLFASGIRYFE